MIVLASDFGLNGPYTGQVKAVLLANAPGIPIVDLFADLPPANPRLSSYLLAAYFVSWTRELAPLADLCALTWGEVGSLGQIMDCSSF